MPYLPGAVAGDPNGLSTQSQLVVDSSNTHVIVFLENITDYIMEAVYVRVSAFTNTFKFSYQQWP